MKQVFTGQSFTLEGTGGGFQTFAEYRGVKEGVTTVYYLFRHKTYSFGEGGNWIRVRQGNSDKPVAGWPRQFRFVPMNLHIDNTTPNIIHANIIHANIIHANAKVQEKQ